MKLDWERGHGPVTGPINAAAATLAASWAGHLADMPWESGATIAGLGLLGTHIAGRRKDMTTATLSMRAAGWLGAGGWSSWAIANGPWTQWGITSLIAGAIGLGAAIAGAHAAERNAPAKAVETARLENAAALDAKRQAIATEWINRILRVTHVQTRIVGVDIDTEGITILDGECAEGGANYKTIKNREEALAADARLPEGCGVEVTSGVNRGAFLMTISTVNKLIDDAPYPNDYSPLSINDGSPLGIHRDGTIGAPVMRQLSATFVGRRGSGKTNLMNVSLTNQCRQIDNLSWVIDLNGGGLALAWLHKWHELGRPGRPPIDWVADTPEKALEMARAALRIAKARKPGYKKREIAANDDKLPVDATVPAITMNNDEIAELFSPKARRDPILKETGDILVQVQELARAVAVNIINAALRATQDVISEPQILVQSGLKIGMKSDEREMNYLFGWDDRISPEDIPYAGCGAMKVEDASARPLKVYRITPDQIAEVIKATSHLQPELDELSRKAAGASYELRWESTDHLFGIGDAPVPAQTAATLDQPTQTPQRRGSGVTANWGKTPANPNIQQSLDQADDAVRRLHKAMDEVGNRDTDLDKQFMDVVDGGGLTWKPPAQDDTADSGKSDPRYQLIYNIVEGAGETGIGPAAISDAFTRHHPDQKKPNDTVIGRWLKADPRVHQPKFGRYAVRPDGALSVSKTEEEPATDSVTVEVNSLIDDATELVVAKQRASASFLQRNLRCSWEVANALLPRLIASGTISSDADVAGAHPVLRKPDEDAASE